MKAAKTRTKKPEPISDAEAELWANVPVTGSENVRLSDCSLWPEMDDEPQLAFWINAFEAAERGNLADLTALLRDVDRQIPVRARWFLADLIGRRIGRKRGRPATPAYDPGPDNNIMMDACEQVKQLTRRCGYKRALEIVAKREHLNEDKLDTFYQKGSDVLGRSGTRNGGPPPKVKGRP